MQPITPKFRRLLKRLDRKITDHDIEAFDGAAAAMIQQAYIDDDPDYAAAVGQVPAAQAAAFTLAASTAPMRALRARHEPLLSEGALAVSRVLEKACLLDLKSPPKRKARTVVKKARAKAAPRKAKLAKTAARKTIAKQPARTASAKRKPAKRKPVKRTR